MNVSTFEAASLGAAKLKAKKLNRDLEEEVVEYTLLMDGEALAKALQYIERDLMNPGNWSGLTGPDIQVICWCTFERFHPDVPLDEVRKIIPPAQTALIGDMLLEMTFPGILVEIAEMKKAGKLEKAQGEPQPSDSAK